MVAPVIIGAAIAGGASLLGGRKSSDEASSINAQQLAFGREQMAFQKEFAQHGVRWRVEDAKAAGLHPLHAMGGILPSASPVSVDFQQSGAGAALAEAGQHVGRAVAAQMTPGERAAQEMQLKLGEAQLEESDARRIYYLSEAARTLGPSQVGPGMPTVNEAEAAGVLPGQVQVQPTVFPTVSGSDPSVMAGDPALWREFSIGNGQKILLPGGVSGDASEALESVSESIPLSMAVLLENIARNPSFGEDTARRYLGSEGAALYRALKHVPGTPQSVAGSLRGVRDSVRRWSDRFRRMDRSN